MVTGYSFIIVFSIAQIFAIRFTTCDILEFKVNILLLNSKHRVIIANINYGTSNYFVGWWFLGWYLNIY